MAEGRTVDINADAGESFGAWTMGADERLFPALTSVNLACGFHAGDPGTMLQTVRLAAAAGLRVGAHPGFPDLTGFGRRDLAMDPEDLYAAVLYQLGALSAFLRREGAALHHVKPHGALYHRMIRDAEAADAVARAVRDFDARIPLIVLGGSGGRVMRAAADRCGLATVAEAFPDRAYLRSGALAPRHLEGATVHDAAAAAERAVRMARGEPIAAIDGGTVTVEARTLCIHGDAPGAPAVAAAVREALVAAGVTVAPF